MLTSDNIKKMKSRSISKNTVMTKLRTKEVLKSANRAQKNEIDALAGVNRASVNRAYATGSISARVAVAIAQVLNLDPAYLTGEAQERGAYNSETLNAFLEHNGYSELIKQEKAPRKQRRKKVVEQAPAEVEAEIVEEAGQVESQEPAVDEVADCQPCAEIEMSIDEAIELLRAVHLRSKFNHSAGQTLAQIQQLLLR